MVGRISKASREYEVKCPDCGSREIWRVGWVPSRAGRKDRFKCTLCGATFYKGQPGTLVGERRRKSKGSKRS